MIADTHTPDLFESMPAAAPPRGVCTGPTFSHPEREKESRWRDGWHRHTGASWEFTPYDPAIMAWVREQLESGPVDYGDLLNARRRAGIEHPFEVHEPIGAHVRYLVLAGEVIERKRYLGSPDPRSPDYHGWHPVLELTEISPCH